MSEHTNFDDGLLLWAERGAAGDAESLDRWYRAEFPRLYRIALGFLADRTDAEEVAREALVRIIDGVGSFDRTRSYGAWRTAITANLCRDRLRRADARRRAEERSLAVRRPGQVVPPDAAAEQAEMTAILIEALQTLPPREREVFVLRDLEGVETADVAAALEITDGSVRSLLALARQRLRRLLAPRLCRKDDDDGR